MRQIVLATIAVVISASPAAALPDGFKARADALLAQSYAADGPGVSVSISEHGRIVYEAQRGMADIAAKRPVAAGTVFRIGSITKQFASATLLQMIGEGRVGLDDPLSKFLPDYPGGRGITIRQLLNHTSGIQSYTDIPGWMTEANTARRYSTAELIAVFKDKPPVTAPGAAWAYNNSGYILVGAVIEAVAKRPWHEEVVRRLTGPQRLRSIRYGNDPVPRGAMATGYTGNEAGPSQPIDMSVPGAAGALVATAGDVTRWGYALHHAKILPAASYAQMIAPTTLPDGTTRPYGFGLMPGTVHGLSAIGHGGGIFGFSSDTMFLPGPDMVVTVLTNSDEPQTSPGVVLRRLAALAADKPYPTFVPQPLDPAAVEPFLGTYRIGGKDRVLRMEDGKLVYRRPDQSTPLIPVGANRFVLGKDGLNWIELGRDAAGQPRITFFTDGVDVDGPSARTGPVPVEATAVAVPAATLARYVGGYSAVFGKIAVAQAASGLTVQVAGQPAFPLRALSPTEFEVAQVGAKVRFLEKDGRITGLEVAQGGRTIPATRD